MSANLYLAISACGNWGDRGAAVEAAIAEVLSGEGIELAPGGVPGLIVEGPGEHVEEGLERREVGAVDGCGDELFDAVVGLRVNLVRLRSRRLG